MVVSWSLIFPDQEKEKSIFIPRQQNWSEKLKRTSALVQFRWGTWGELKSSIKQAFLPEQSIAVQGYVTNVGEVEIIINQAASVHGDTYYRNYKGAEIIAG